MKMEYRKFYTSKTKFNLFSKLLNYMLLMMGSSSIIDVEKIVIGEKVEIKYCVGESTISKYEDIYSVKDNYHIREIEFSGKRI